MIFMKNNLKTKISKVNIEWVEKKLNENFPICSVVKEKKKKKNTLNMPLKTWREEEVLRAQDRVFQMAGG